MHLSIGSLILATPILVTALTNPSCQKDACLKALHTNLHGSVGCRGFFRVTVSPQPVTSTVYQATSTKTDVSYTTTDVLPESTFTADGGEETTTVPVTSTITLDKRDSTAADVTISMTTVPPYAASACANTDQYASACSCIGRTRTTVTLRTKTTTTTVGTVTTEIQKTAFETTPTVTVTMTKTVTVSNPVATTYACPTA